MLDCCLAVSCPCNDSNLCKSSRISFPSSWKRQKFWKVFNAFAIWTMLKKKKEQTSEQSSYLINAVINIWMPEMSIMIHSKTSFECSR